MDIKTLFLRFLIIRDRGIKQATNNLLYTYIKSGQSQRLTTLYNTRYEIFKLGLIYFKM